MGYCKMFSSLALSGRDAGTCTRDIQHLCSILILVTTALFTSLSLRSLGTRNVFRAPPAKRNEKGSGDENVQSHIRDIFTLAPYLFRSAPFRQQNSLGLFYSLFSRLVDMT